MKHLLLLLAALLLLCLAPLPYGFYQLVMFVMMVAFAVMAYVYHEEKKTELAGVFEALALLSQPLLYISLLSQKAALTDQQGGNIEQEDVVYFLDDSVVSYVDRKYKVKVNYPRAFTELDTSTVGTTLFYYPNKQAPNVVLRLFISESKKEWEEVAAVRSATEAFLKKETASYYLFSGSGWWYNQNFMMEKVYKVDGKWIDLTMYYTELGTPKRVDIMDDWTPFDNMKRHRVAKPVINNMTITDKEAGRRQVSFESESELDYDDRIISLLCMQTTVTGAKVPLMNTTYT